MKFVDRAKIEVYAGNGGAGSVHMRREKFLPQGGPDGGNGGAGGSVVLKASTSSNTLISFSYNPILRADHGKPGDGNLKEGRSGKTLVVEVPVGTQVFFGEKLIADLAEEGSLWLAARGGRGGKGNAFFKTARSQAPEHAQPGEVGEAFQFILELKSVADIGLVGLPNAGKSSLISCISDAKPEIANYPFTTKSPNLGVVESSYGSRLVVADIPGLIPDAHKGKGLGIQFLKHIERTSAIVHLVDVSDLDPSKSTENRLESIREDIKAIIVELESFSERLAGLPRALVFTKSDLPAPDGLFESLASEFPDSLLISSHTHEGLDKVKELMFHLQAKSIEEAQEIKQS